MPQVKLLEGVTKVAQVSGDRWFVSNGSTSVGPVEFERIARGIEAGKIPSESFVRHDAWKVWRPLSELAEVIADEDPEQDTIKIRKSDRNRSSTEIPALNDTSPSHSESMPPGPDDGTAENHDAMLMLMHAAVARVHAEVAIVHEAIDDGAIAVCAHGPQMFEALGLKTKLLDPVLLAAAAGALVLAEPTPGPAGQSIIARLERLGASVTGAAMFPIRPHDRLFGTLEIGRRAPFQAEELAGVSALVDVLVEKLESASTGKIGKSAA